MSSVQRTDADESVDLLFLEEIVRLENGTWTRKRIRPRTQKPLSLRARKTRRKKFQDKLDFLKGISYVRKADAFALLKHTQLRNPNRLKKLGLNGLFLRSCTYFAEKSNSSSLRRSDSISSERMDSSVPIEDDTPEEISASEIIQEPGASCPMDQQPERESDAEPSTYLSEDIDDDFGAVLSGVEIGLKEPNLTIKEILSHWTVTHNIPHSAITDLVELLTFCKSTSEIEYGDLPKHGKTLVQVCMNNNVLTMNLSYLPVE